jgi:selenocysteine-specific elongation factor
MEAAVRLAGGRGLPAEEVPMATGLTLEETEAVEADPPGGLLRLQGRWFRSDLVEGLRERLLEDLARMHREDRRSRGASLEALRSGAGRSYAEAVVERALDELIEAGEVVTEGPRVRLPGHEPTLTEEEAEVRDDLLERIEAGGLEPDTVQDLGDELGVPDDLLHDLLELLTSEGSLVAVTPEIYLTAEAEARLREIARGVLEAGPLPAPVQAFKDAYGVSRKYLIPYMEHLDDLGLTRRTGEGRRPGPRAEGAEPGGG